MLPMGGPSRRSVKIISTCPKAGSIEGYLRECKRVVWSLQDRSYDRREKVEADLGLFFRRRGQLALR